MSITANNWYSGRYYDDELNLIYTGWFIWLCDDAFVSLEQVVEYA